MMQNKIENMPIQWIPKQILVSQLQPFEKNPRNISEQNYQKLVNSLKEDGYHNRIITTPDLRVIGGHQRIKALKQLGIAEIEVLIADRDLSDEQFKRILVRDNLGFGEWDLGSLGELMPVGELLELGLPTDIAKAIVPIVKQGLTDEDAIPEPPSEPITVLGDLWILGDHRLLCGDSTSIDAVEKLMGGGKADMVFTDPPYGIDYSGGRTQVVSTKEYGKLKNDTLQGDDLGNLICNINLFNKLDADVYICVSPIMTKPFLDFLYKINKKIDAIIVWDKKNAGLGYMAYRRQCEFILFSKGSKFKKGDKSDFDLWQVSRDNGKDYVHGTQKPVEIPQRAIENSSKTDDIVLDLFGGSGSTLIACEKTNRHSRLMELDPKYCDVIIKRWQDFTGRTAVHAETGEPFNKPEKAAA